VSEGIIGLFWSSNCTYPFGYPNVRNKKVKVNRFRGVWIEVRYWATVEWWIPTIILFRVATPWLMFYFYNTSCVERPRDADWGVKRRGSVPVAEPQRKNNLTIPTLQPAFLISHFAVSLLNYCEMRNVIAKWEILLLHKLPHPEGPVIHYIHKINPSR